MHKKLTIDGRPTSSVNLGIRPRRRGATESRKSQSLFDLGIRTPPESEDRSANSRNNRGLQ